MKNYLQKGESVTIAAPHAVASGGMKLEDIFSQIQAGEAGRWMNAGLRIMLKYASRPDRAVLAAPGW